MNGQCRIYAARSELDLGAVVYLRSAVCGGMAAGSSRAGEREARGGDSHCALPCLPFGAKKRRRRANSQQGHRFFFPT
jgi:hypothetical protein